jgi:hypothetical protein
MPNNGYVPDHKNLPVVSYLTYGPIEEHNALIVQLIVLGSQENKLISDSCMGSILAPCILLTFDMLYLLNGLVVHSRFEDMVKIKFKNSQPIE